MEVGQLLDALSVSFFALLGLWAGAVRGHWFLRAATVSSFLLITLLLPAYELVIEFGLQMAIIATAVAYARGRIPWRARWSLETALLLTVVLAVAFAIIGNLPEFTAGAWLGMLGVGVVTALYALLCLWMVFGRSSLWRRAVGGAMASVVLLALMHLGAAVQYALSTPTRSPLALMLEYYAPEYLPVWFTWNGKTTALGLAIMIGTLLLARASRLFDGPNADASSEQAAHRPLVQQLARLGLFGMFAALGLPLLYVLYRLLTPPPLPAIAEPEPNAYHHFIAAGRNASSELTAIDLSTVPSWSFNKLQETHDLAAPVVEQVRQALTFPSQIPDPFHQSSRKLEMEAVALQRIFCAQTLRLYYFSHYGTAAELADEAIAYLRYGHAINRGLASSYEWTTAEYEWRAIDCLQQAISRLSADECRNAAQALLQVDHDREPLAAVLARTHLLVKHQGWDAHLRALLTEWSGRDIVDVKDSLEVESYYIARLRVTALAFALQAYILDHGRPPDSLEELVPHYAVQVPADSENQKPVVYRRRGNRYTLYSVGPNGADDGGASLNLKKWPGTGDIVARGPHRPPPLIALRDKLLDRWRASQPKEASKHAREGEAPSRQSSPKSAKP
jgi:hypothetical protein